MGQPPDDRWIDELLTSPELHELDAITPPFDPLEVLSWTHQERPYTRFLAWLLEPREPRPGGGHNLATTVLHSLVNAALSSLEFLPGSDAIGLPKSVAAIPVDQVTVTREMPVGDGVRVSARAPDIRCTWTGEDCKPWILIVENKVDADEGDGQVREYLAWAVRHHPNAHRLLIYVTPDGRSPVSSLPGEAVVPLSWSDVADAALEGIKTLPHSEDPSRVFAVTVLQGLRARFGGSTRARELVEALHAAHPRGAALVSSPATESSLLRRFKHNMPRALWHLKTLRPRSYAWTHSWATRVTMHLNSLLHGKLTVRNEAPHVEQPNMASWSIDAVTQSLSLYLFCTAGTAFNSHRPRAWIALRAPNLSARDAFTSRDQLQAIEQLPAVTREWILGATPVIENPGSWSWLCVGEASILRRGFSLDDDASRTAHTLLSLLLPHHESLVAFTRDPSLRLFSCDLDAHHIVPHDVRDREALASDRLPDADHVVIATRKRTGHSYDLRAACELGVALGTALGSTRRFSYDYVPGGVVTGLQPSIVLVDLNVFSSPIDASYETTVQCILASLRGGAHLFVCGNLTHLTQARKHLGKWLHGLEGSWQREHFEDEGSTLHASHTLFKDFEGSNVRWIQSAFCFRVNEGVRVAINVRCASEDVWPLVAGWRAGSNAVVYIGSSLDGFGSRSLLQKPEILGRWWRTLVAFAATL
jgi:hypothetical protein